MSLIGVKSYLAKFGLDNDIIEVNDSSATVHDAAISLNTDEDRIAKSLSFLVGEDVVVIVVSGRSKIDNYKYKAFFHKKAKMIPFDDVEKLTSHPVGGVCPFALPDDVKTYLDVSLKRFDTVFPAVGSAASAIELTCDELERCCGKNFVQWVDVCKGWQPEEA